MKLKQLSVSADPELRRAIEAEAEKLRCSVSEVIRLRLWESFGGPEKVRYEQAWLETGMGT